MDEARIQQLRTDYAAEPLREEDVGDDPVGCVRRWLAEAVNAELPEPNAMTLATVDEAGDPDARIVLLKGIEHDRFVFYTNYASAKGRQLAARPRATLVLFWAEFARQVRIHGAVERVARETSRAYFQSRPRPSQVAAWSSAQSEVVPDRGALDARYAEMERRFEGVDPLPLPDAWGGYAVRAQSIELWHGRHSRLHDRLLARREGERWVLSRLAP